MLGGQRERATPCLKEDMLEKLRDMLEKLFKEGRILSGQQVGPDI